MPTQDQIEGRQDLYDLATEHINRAIDLLQSAKKWTAPEDAYLGWQKLRPAIGQIEEAISIFNKIQAFNIGQRRITIKK